MTRFFRTSFDVSHKEERLRLYLRLRVAVARVEQWHQFSVRGFEAAVVGRTAGDSGERTDVMMQILVDNHLVGQLGEHVGAEVIAECRQKDVAIPTRTQERN